MTFPIVDNVIVSYHDEPVPMWNLVSSQQKKQFPFARLAPLCDEYSAIQHSVVTYNLARASTWLNAQMPTFGLVDSVLLPRIVRGTVTYKHDYNYPLPADENPGSVIHVHNLALFEHRVHESFVGQF